MNESPSGPVASLCFKGCCKQTFVQMSDPKSTWEQQTLKSQISQKNERLASSQRSRVSDCGSGLDREANGNRWRCRWNLQGELSTVIQSLRRIPTAHGLTGARVGDWPKLRPTEDEGRATGR